VYIKEQFYYKIVKISVSDYYVHCSNLYCSLMATEEDAMGETWEGQEMLVGKPEVMMPL
jgi:hypothetical protein